MKRACLLLFLLLIACQRSDNTNFVGEAMTMQYRITVGAPLNEKKRKTVKSVISKSFSEIDRIYNKWNPKSEISRLNKTKAFEKIPLSKELEAFLLETEKLVAISDGNFDPTIESVQKIWNDHFKLGELPNPEKVTAAMRSVGWKKVHIENGFFWKEEDALEIDLGGIAKGYAIDMIVERLNEEGFFDVYVEWGGEIRTSGLHPDNRPWRILVSKMGNPDPASALAIVDLSNVSVASSGDYMQNCTIEGVTYFHIIDPKTCTPLIASNGSISGATIITKKCMHADVLATAAMQFSTQETAEAWLEEKRSYFPDLQYWITTR